MYDKIRTNYLLWGSPRCDSPIRRGAKSPVCHRSERPLCVWQAETMEAVPQAVVVQEGMALVVQVARRGRRRREKRRGRLP